MGSFARFGAMKRIIEMIRRDSSRAGAKDKARNDEKSLLVLFAP